ncbi:hypothetical protein CLV35_2064 [Motilibacter peucedani]|uniref:Uncharacterized protein n=1 Tax=Motilibacter peucedani TaxID=598650 RepID=A0A420XQP1_9ACTN|nr:hypothetical protein CLV35_2064 [Motilibacter peucedani]
MLDLLLLLVSAVLLCASGRTPTSGSAHPSAHDAGTFARLLARAR